MKFRLIAGGLAIGAANGLFGGGGGMIAVPILEAAGRPAREAHASAIAVILPASAFGAAVYLLLSRVPFPVLLPVAMGVTAGGILGARLLKRLAGGAVSLLFAALMLAAGLWMLL